MFRNIIILGIAIAAASAAGWFTVNREGDRTTIQINRDEIRNDTRRAMDRSREFLDHRGQPLADSSRASGQDWQATNWQGSDWQGSNWQGSNWQGSAAQQQSIPNSADRRYWIPSSTQPR
jgi:hypothetical protein